MGTYLYRLGRFSYRRRRRVLALWLALLAAVGVGAATLPGPAAGEFSVPGTESQRALDLLHERLPEVGGDTATARVVLTLGDGVAGTLDDPARHEAIERVVAALRQAPLVARAGDPFTEGGVASDGRTAYIQVAYQVQSRELTDGARAALFAAADPARAAGIGVEFGGTAVEKTPEQSATEIIGLGVAAVVLVITFGSFVAAGLPLLTAILGVALGLAATRTATALLDLDASVPVPALTLGLAVAVGYALFIVSRYRHEISTGRDSEDAVGRAVGAAGTAVVVAGLTVVIALGALAVVAIPFLTATGLAAAATVAVAVAVALTLLPAVLGFAGRRIAGGRTPGPRPKDPGADTAARSAGRWARSAGRWARAVVRRPIPAIVLAVVALGLVAVPAADLRLGPPDAGTAAPDSTQRRAYDQLSAGFGAGFNGPLLLVVEAVGSDDPATAVERVRGAVAAMSAVAMTGEPRFDAARDTAALRVIPVSGPSEPATENLVHALRALAPGLAVTTGASVSVTGQTAISLDVSEKISDALLPYLAVVSGLAFVLLILVLRGVLVPRKATAGLLLSVVATFGAVAAVFRWGWPADGFVADATRPFLSLLPIFLIGMLFAHWLDRLLPPVDGESESDAEEESESEDGQLVHALGAGDAGRDQATGSNVPGDGDVAGLSPYDDARADTTIELPAGSGSSWHPETGADDTGAQTAHARPRFATDSQLIHR